MDWRPHSPGTLVKINTLKTATQDGLATARAGPHNSIIVTELIDLESYPSWNDFRGKEILCDADTPATIISFAGRPLHIRDTAGWEYDVYEVLVNQNVCQLFSANLKSVEEASAMNESIFDEDV